MDAEHALSYGALLLAIAYFTYNYVLFVVAGRKDAENERRVRRGGR